MPKRYFIETYGCQMNVNDSEKVAGLLRGEGYERADAPGEADVVFINTCAVREKAADKLYHSLGRLKALKRERPELLLGVGGCVAQLQGQAVIERAPQVDVLVGTHNVARVPELLRQARKGVRGIDLDRGADSFAIPDESIEHGSSVRAYVTVMEGCNHVCSFCVVPRTRGPEVCRPADNVVNEVASLVRRGYPEVMLLGQTVNAYHHGTADFPELLARVHDVPGLKRLRFTTSHPEHVSPGMARAFGALERLCPYLHLPPQSGSDQVLAAMRRGYTRAQYVDTIALLRAHRPDIALSGDVIVGHPTESEGDFEATVELVEQIGFDALFVFMYSPRPGTTDLRLGDPVSRDEKGRRFQVLNTLQQRLQRSRNAARVGLTEEVLVDSSSGPGRLAGRSPHFRIVHFDGSEELLGTLVRVEVVDALPNSLLGRIQAVA